MAYTVPAIAVLALLSTMIDDKPIVDMLPETISPSTLSSGLQLQQQQVIDYFGQFAKTVEAGDLLDLAIASVALPTIYTQAIDTFSEQKKSTSGGAALKTVGFGDKADKAIPENKFQELIKNGMPVNMTKDVSKEFKNYFKDDFTKPPGTFGAPAYAPDTGFSKK